MIPHSKDKEAVAHDERVAKVFIVIDDDTRRCLVCEKLFTRQGSFEHSKTVCYPPASSTN